MASDAQINANRLNAEKSTGPRTPEGKAVVAQNAVKHGLRTRKDVIAGEDPQEFERWRQGWLSDLQPVGQAEDALAERIVGLSWRLRRAQWLQNEAFDGLLIRDLSGACDDAMRRFQAPWPDSMTDPDRAVGRMIVDDFSGHRALDRLHICEQRIEGSLYRTMNQLDKRQAQRRRAGEATADEAGPVCSVPVRASHVAQPPSAGNTAEDGGATCDGAASKMDSTEQSQSGPSQETPYDVTTNGTDCAKQSQLAEREQGAGGGQPAGGLCETKPIDPAGPVCSVPVRASAQMQDETTTPVVADSTEQSQAGPSQETPYDVTTNGIDCAKQSQLQEVGGGYNPPDEIVTNKPKRLWSLVDMAHPARLPSWRQSRIL